MASRIDEVTRGGFGGKVIVWIRGRLRTEGGFYSVAVMAGARPGGQLSRHELPHAGALLITNSGQPIINHWSFRLIVWERENPHKLKQVSAHRVQSGRCVGKKKTTRF